MISVVKAGDTFRVLPFTGLQTALQVNLGAFREVLGADLGQSAEGNDAMPFGRLLRLPSLSFHRSVVAMRKVATAT
jgi:hypothetical protein